MKKYILKISVLMTAFFFFGNLHAQYNVEFSQTFGGGGEEFHMLKQLPDSTYMACGYSESFAPNPPDAFVVRMDPLGNLLQLETFEGLDFDYFGDFEILPDGGFAFGGGTNSYGSGQEDMWVVRTNSNLDTLWTRTFGSEKEEHFYSILATNDGGFLLTGWKDIDFEKKPYVVKLNGLGELEWEKTYTELDWDDRSKDAVETADGGFLIISGKRHGLDRGRISKIDANGAILWKKGYSNLGLPEKIHKISRNNYLVVGAKLNNEAAYLLKTDENGNEIRRGEYGGASSESGIDVVETLDCGYLLVGTTNSYGAGATDVYIVKTDSNLVMEWDTTFGDGGNNWASSIIKTYDDGYAISGFGPSALFLKLGPLEVNSSYIRGKVYFDRDANNVFNAGDMPLVNAWVKAGGFQTQTNDEGDYEFRVSPGTYTITPNAGEPWKDYGYLPANCTVTINAGEDKYCGDFGYGFPTTPSCPNNIAVTIQETPLLNSESCDGAALTTPCPGDSFRYCVTITNNSIDTIYAEVEKNILEIRTFSDPEMIFLYDDSDSNPTLSYVNTVGGRRTYDLSADLLGGGQSTKVCLTYLVNTSANFIPFDAKATLECRPDEPVTIPVEANQSVLPNNLCNQSCDPNDKIAFQKGCGPGGSIFENDSTQLTYMVRFENRGALHAQKLVIRDILDEDLDFATLQVLETSHPLTNLQIENNNVLNFTFENINLAPIDYPEVNKGYVMFTVKPKSGLPDGTEITNSAAIYFDCRPPEYTNTTVNTFPKILNPPDFRFKRSCNDINAVYDFFYTGEDTGVGYFWDFDGVATSTDQNPSGIQFPESGDYAVTLTTIDKYGCTVSITKTVSTIDYSSYEIVPVCHWNNALEVYSRSYYTVYVSASELEEHLNHGDCIGPCPENSSRIKSEYVTAIDLSNRVKLYPNPTNKNLTIDLSEIPVINSASLRLSDVYGTLLSEQFNIVPINQMDLSELSDGIYFLTITINGSPKTYKIVKN